ncbi:MAG: HD domain-containing protein [Eubacteriales bacterium]|nr:HD domain-containing protein [Eubacteriales bacterium]
MTRLVREIKEEQEKHLSPFAARSHDSRGRMLPEKECTVRTIFERDAGRIIFSMEFRRLRHKTQVFFDPQNDHICTRMEHVIYVNYIANTIGRALGLNPDLIQAIALGHDLGHAPFGHSGERMLDACIKKSDPSLYFKHELHSLRVVDKLSEHKDRHGINLSFEARDGIASHCGETYSEYEMTPNRLKHEQDLISDACQHGMPATLEGCVVRIADKIAYVGRDIEDAARAGIMEFEDIPAAIRNTLGATNGQIINTLVNDIIEHSAGQDAIILSPEHGLAMEDLLRENVARIYRSDKIKRYENMVKNVTEGLYEVLIVAGTDLEKLKTSKQRTFRDFATFIENHPCPTDSLAQQVIDYIAGMTDSFATKSFEDVYWF